MCEGHDTLSSEIITRIFSLTHCHFKTSSMKCLFHRKHEVLFSSHYLYLSCPGIENLHTSGPSPSIVPPNRQWIEHN